MDNNQAFSSIIEFVDLGANDKAVVIVKSVKNSVGLTLSLEHGSDTEVIMRHSESVRLAETLQQAIRENEIQIVNQIETLINEALPNLSPHLSTWVESHRITPHQVTMSLNDDGTDEITLWLVTENIGENDSASRIVFDEIKDSFGLVMALQNDIQWFMGHYGGFAETVNAM